MLKAKLHYPITITKIEKSIFWGIQGTLNKGQALPYRGNAASSPLHPVNVHSKRIESTIYR